MKRNYYLIVKHIVVVFLLLGTTHLISCVTPAVKPKEATFQKGEGRLITGDNYQFSYRYYPVEQKGPSVIFITGLGGKVSGGYYLASPINKANFNFIGFDRAGRYPLSVKDAYDMITERSKSGNIMWPSVDGKESGTENILRNEISAIIEFAENSPTHDPKQGIYLIGASYGSWLSLVTVNAFPDKIKGVVFLSPAIPSNVVVPNQAQNPTMNITKYFKTMIGSFGQRPALAIGSKTDILIPDKPNDGSALDSAIFLKNEIGANVEVMELSTSLHEQNLIMGSEEVRSKIVQWLKEQSAK
jgi:pimeloyl-ACP methyl ester carboxylesterase